MRKASDARKQPVAPMHKSGVQAVYEVPTVVVNPAAIARHRLIDVHHRLNRVSGGLVIAITRGLGDDELGAYAAELVELSRELKRG